MDQLVYSLILNMLLSERTVFCLRRGPSEADCAFQKDALSDSLRVIPQNEVQTQSLGWGHGLDMTSRIATSMCGRPQVLSINNGWAKTDKRKSEMEFRRCGTNSFDIRLSFWIILFEVSRHLIHFEDDTEAPEFAALSPKLFILHMEPSIQ